MTRPGGRNDLEPLTGQGEITLSRSTVSPTEGLQSQSSERIYESEISASEFVVPVIQEDLDIHKEVFRTGTVRLRKVVHEVPETISDLLTSESVEIERIPKDMMVETAPPVRMEGDVTVISIVEEVLVVTKQLRLREELRISKRRVVSEYQEEVVVRSEELIVERVDHTGLTNI